MICLSVYSRIKVVCQLITRSTLHVSPPLKRYTQEIVYTSLNTTVIVIITSNPVDSAEQEDTVFNNPLGRGAVSFLPESANKSEQQSGNFPLLLQRTCLSATDFCQTERGCSLLLNVMEACKKPKSQISWKYN